MNKEGQHTQITFKNLRKGRLTLKLCAGIQVIFILFLFFGFQIASSGNYYSNRLQLRHLTTENGLANNLITAIHQDHLGFIWIGTEEGLCRYNGYSFDNYYHSTELESSVADNHIFDIFEDDENNLWVGTQRGLSLYDYATDRFTSYYPDEKNNHQIASNWITGIAQNSKGELFITTDNGKLYRFNISTNTFEELPVKFENIHDLLIDDTDGIWVGGISGILYYYPELNIVRKYSVQEDDKNAVGLQPINTLFEEGDTIWAGGRQGAVYYILRSEKKLYRYQNRFENEYYIHDILKSSQGIFYITTSEGILEFIKNEDTYQWHTYERGNRSGLNSFGTTVLFEDRQKNLWIGTNTGGINLKIKQKAFHNYDLIPGSEIDLRNINAIAESDNGDLWLGSFDEGIIAYNPINGEIKEYYNLKISESSLGYGSVYEIYSDSRNNIWVGTYLGYLQKYDRESEQFISYPYKPEMGEASPGKDIRAIYEDEEGMLWLISHGFGLSRFNPNTKEFKHYRHDDKNPDNSLADNWAFDLDQDSSGNFWIATPSGLSLFNPKTETFQNFYNQANDSTSLSNSEVNTLLVDSKQRLWVGTSYGLNLYDQARGKFRRFFDSDGLPSNQIKAIIEHSSNEIWVSTSDGLCRIRMQATEQSNDLHLVFKSYGRIDGLQDMYYWDRSACKLKNSEIMFGGINGFVRFDPLDIEDNAVPPDVFITDFHVFNESFPDYHPKLSIPGSDSGIYSINLNYDQNSLEFEFVATNFIAAEKNLFRYKLEGHDKDWIFADKENIASYHNLPPGDYTFRVLAANNDGYWNAQGASLHVVISPPFWRTWWFILIQIILFTGIALKLYSYRVRIYRQEHTDLEDRVRERTEALTQANNELLTKHEKILSQNAEINRKNREIEIQHDELERQKARVDKAYEELTLYRNKLENLVDERTRELIIAKEKAEESDQLKSSFLSNLSHEIRTPLNSIIGFTTLLFDEDLPAEERDNYKSIIDTSSSGLLNLINDIIDFSKIESNDLPLNKQQIALDQFIKKLDRIYSMEIWRQQKEEQKVLDFKVNVSEEVKGIVLYNDEMRLQQLIGNLINNAIKFTYKGSVTISVSKEKDGYLLFEIKDTGIGISEEFKKVIFHRFRKVENDKSRLFRGAGLGLTITEHLLQMMGGRIWVESELNIGSSFFVSLPVSVEEKSESIEKQKAAELSIPNLKKRRILIAEDDVTNYLFLARLLKATNAKIIKAENGKEVIEMLESDPHFDLILMDIKMPVMDGIEAFKEIKRMKIDIPVVAQTAYAFSNEIEKIKALGFTNYITKPIDQKELYQLLTEILLKHV